MIKILKKSQFIFKLTCIFSLEVLLIILIAAAATQAGGLAYRPRLQVLATNLDVIVFEFAALICVHVYCVEGIKNMIKLTGSKKEGLYGALISLGIFAFIIPRSTANLTLFLIAYVTFLWVAIVKRRFSKNPQIAVIVINLLVFFNFIFNECNVLVYYLQRGVMDPVVIINFVVSFAKMIFILVMFLYGLFLLKLPKEM